MKSEEERMRFMSEVMAKADLLEMRFLFALKRKVKRGRKKNESHKEV